MVELKQLLADIKANYLQSKLAKEKLGLKGSSLEKRISCALASHRTIELIKITGDLYRNRMASSPIVFEPSIETFWDKFSAELFHLLCIANESYNKKHGVPLSLLTAKDQDTSLKLHFENLILRIRKLVAVQCACVENGGELLQHFDQQANPVVHLAGEQCFGSVMAWGESLFRHPPTPLPSAAAPPTQLQNCLLMLGKEEFPPELPLLELFMGTPCLTKDTYLYQKHREQIFLASPDRASIQEGCDAKIVAEAAFAKFKLLKPKTQVSMLVVMLVHKHKLHVPHHAIGIARICVGKNVMYRYMDNEFAEFSAPSAKQFSNIMHYCFHANQYDASNYSHFRVLHSDGVLPYLSAFVHKLEDSKAKLTEALIRSYAIIAKVQSIKQAPSASAAKGAIVFSRRIAPKAELAAPTERKKIKKSEGI